MSILDFQVGHGVLTGNHRGWQSLKPQALSHLYEVISYWSKTALSLISSGEERSPALFFIRSSYNFFSLWSLIWPTENKETKEIKKIKNSPDR